MPKKENPKPEEESTKAPDSSLTRITEAEKEFSECSSGSSEAQKSNGISWDQKESLFFGKYINTDKDGNVTVKRDSTGEITTLAIDRASRNMAQLPSGRFENYSDDPGKNVMMNLLFEHYVIPYARKGGPMKIRLRMVDLYSELYTIPVLVEWIASEKYSGPDWTIIDIRRFFPQPGKASIDDMDYCFVETFVSKKWIEGLDEQFYKNKAKILTEAKEEEISNSQRSYLDRGSKSTGIRIRHRLGSNGDWLAYLPGTQDKIILIDEQEYFPRIPIVLKQQFARIDTIWSYTNFDRGYSTQEKIDRLNEMNLRATEMMIDPPLIMDPAKVIMSSIKRQKGANFLLKKGVPSDVQAVNIAPDALRGFQSQYSVFKANLQSIGAQTDTSVSKDVDPGFGKSPEALKQQDSRMGSRDSWHQDMMEIFVEDLFSLMADLLASKGIDKYSFNMLSGAIDQIKEDYPEEAQEIESFVKDGKMELPVDQVEGKYRYIIEPGSMLMQADDVAGPILQMMKIYAENPSIKADLEASGQKMDLGVAFKAIAKSADSKLAKKLIVQLQNPESVKGVGGAEGTPAVEEEIPTEESPEAMIAEAVTESGVQSSQ